MPEKSTQVLPQARTINKQQLFDRYLRWSTMYSEALLAGDITKDQHDRRVAKNLQTLKTRSLQLEQQTEIDPLTHLPNYRGTEKIAHLLATRGKPFGMIIIDLRHFGDINNDPRYGFDVGNQLLAETAKRLEGTLYHDRAEENDIVTLYDLNVAQDTPTRKHGEHGDEFLLFLPSVQNQRQLEVVCKKLMSAFQIPLVVMKNGTLLEVQVDLSVGATIYRDGMNPESVADILSKEVAKIKAIQQEGGYAIFDIGKPSTRRSHTKVQRHTIP